MSAYPPPTRILSLFNPLNFETSNEDITVGYLDTNYLKFPIAQGLENLQKTNITDATQSTDITSGSLVTAGGVGIAKQTHIGGQLHCTSVATSSNTTTGCIRANGGVGVAENINAGGIIKTTSTTASTDTTTGALLIGGGAGIVGRINAGGIIKTTDATASTDTTTGALQVGGGAGIVGAVNVGGALNATSDISTTSGVYKTTGDLRVLSANGLADTQSVFVAGQQSVFYNGNQTVEYARFNSTGLVVAGALAVNTGGIIKTTATTTSTNTTTGALQVGGGAGIAGAVNVGSNLVCGGSNGTSNAFTSFTSKKYSAGSLGFVNAFSITTAGNYGASYLEVMIMGTYTGVGQVCIKYELAIAPNDTGTNFIYVNDALVTSGNNLTKTLEVISGGFELRQTTVLKVTTFAVYSPGGSDYSVYVRYLAGQTPSTTGTITML
jgi:hypothetical protein